MKPQTILVAVAFIAMVVLLASNYAMTLSGTNNSETTGIANPASVHCVDLGYQLEIRTSADGGQYGVCMFPDGTECEEWEFFRGECSPGMHQTVSR